jgi:hypothetical protein
MVRVQWIVVNVSAEFHNPSVVKPEAGILTDITFGRSDLSLGSARSHAAWTWSPGRSWCSSDVTPVLPLDVPRRGRIDLVKRARRGIGTSNAQI